MKKHFKLVLFVVLFTCTTLPAWGQASTQGKEFWVSSTLVCSPNKATPAPYIAISAEKACTVKIEGGVGNAISITQQVAAGSWNEFGNGNTSQTNPNAGMVKVPMDASKWYPTSMSDASQVRTLAGQKNMYGLHITATENVSVYVILSSTNSMDASNILPVTALGSEYYTQDYWPIVKSDFNNTVSMVTILATEDGTKVDIIPNGNTYDGHNDGQLYTVELVKGQTYYLMSEVDKQITGTHIQARDNKKIAVYCGVPLTNLPTDIAARDCLFEQSMPVEYWGTQFIVTRSLQKNGNLIGITATVDGTELKVDGYQQAFINQGETFYMMLQSTNDPNGNKPGTSPIDLVVTADVAYIETSCPSAVYNYDTGNSYKGKNGDEIDNSKGDPSSIWVSPIQQKINAITFGTCYTNKTQDHFLNVVTETATCNDTKLIALYGQNTLDKTSLLTWTPVPGNTRYSYARAKIGDSSTAQYSVFRLSNPKGVLATVYGNGNDESYAYSAGSAAVEQGVNVEGITFPDGYRNTTDKFCIGSELSFDANVGSDEITRVDWDFGDGITENNGTVQISHQYTTPGWYDVKANLYGHQVCTDESDQYIGSVSFSFRVVRTDTVTGSVAERICISPDSILDGTKLTAEQVAELLVNGENEIVPVGELLIGGCYDTVLVNYHPYGLETIEETTTLNLEILPGEESVYCPELKKSLTSSVEDTVITTNEYGCNHYHPYFVKVKACLYMNLENDPKLLSVCEGQTLEVGYKKRGDVENARLIIEPQSVAWLDNTSTNTSTNEAPVPPASEDMTVPNPVIDLAFGWTDGIDDGIIHENPDGSGTLVLPTQTLKPGIYDLTLELTDASEECLNTDTFLTRTITIKYPESVVVQKFVNVLAVLNAQYNGGYEFVGFQWYKNGEILPGETGAVYHTIAPFSVGDTYSVELTDAAGNKLPSCDFEIKTEPGYNTIQEEGEEEPAQKLIQNNRIVIRRDGQTYNIFGQKVR